MKNKVLIVVGVLICINSCRMPSNPLGEINIIKRLETINTEGNCLDLDVDIEGGQGLLIAAANYNGVFIYDIQSDDNGIVSEIEKEPIHIEPDEMDSNIGDNRAQHVILSKTNKIAFILDEYEAVCDDCYFELSKKWKANLRILYYKTIDFFKGLAGLPTPDA